MGTTASKYKKFNSEWDEIPTQMKEITEYDDDLINVMDTKRVRQSEMIDDDKLFIPRNIFNKKEIDKDIKIAEKIQSIEHENYEKYLSNLEKDRIYALNLQSKEDEWYAKQYSQQLNNSNEQIYENVDIVRS